MSRLGSTLARVSVALAPVIAAVIAGGPAVAQADERVLRLGERSPIAVVVAAPTGDEARVRSSELIRVVDELLRARTDLALQLVEASALADCQGRLVCLVEKVGDGTATDRAAPSFLLVLSNVTRAGEPDRLSAQLVDVARAQATVARAASGGAVDAWRDQAEATLNEEALSTERAAVADLAAAQRVLTEWLERRFAPTLQAADHWEPYGEVVVVSGRAGLELRVDGQAVGTTEAGRTRVAEVRAGARVLALVGPMIERYEATITVARGESVLLEPELTSAQSTSPVRDAVMISGVVLASAGVVAGVLALATADGDVVSHCFQGTPGCADGTAFVGSGASTARAAQLEPVGTGGVLLLPLGYSLLGAGAVWTVGAWLSQDEVPWVPVLVGLGVGTLAYAVSAAAGAPSDGAP